MKENKLNALNNKRRSKYTEYVKTSSISWKKKLRKYELEILDGKIKIEKLRQQFN